MTDTAASAEAPPATLSPRDESRVRLSLDAFLLASAAADLMPADPEAASGDLLRTALDLRKRLERLVESAVIAERERGSTWEQIGAAAGMTRQAAHEKWAPDVTAWARTGRSTRKSSDPTTTLDRARQLDDHYARFKIHPQDAVTAGLDAVRFPGSDVYEYDRRRRGAALHDRFRELGAQEEALTETFHQLKAAHDTDAVVGAAALAANLTASADLKDQIADVYEQLATAEPALAEEHRNEAEQYRKNAQNSRDYAEGVTTNWGRA